MHRLVSLFTPGPHVSPLLWVFFSFLTHTSPLLCLALQVVRAEKNVLRVRALTAVSLLCTPRPGMRVLVAEGGGLSMQGSGPGQWLRPFLRAGALVRLLTKVEAALRWLLGIA